MRTASDRVTERGFTAALSPQANTLLYFDPKGNAALVLLGGRRPAQDAWRGRSHARCRIGRRKSLRTASNLQSRTYTLCSGIPFAYIFSLPDAAGFPEPSHVMSPVASKIPVLLIRLGRKRLDSQLAIMTFEHAESPRPIPIFADLRGRMDEPTAAVRY